MKTVGCRACLLITIIAALALAGCNSSDSADEQTAAASQPSLATTSPGDADHFHAELSLAGPLAISSDGKNIFVSVQVKNDGVGTFGSSTTPNNVNLGAHGLDFSGKIIDNDLARGHLPQIASGEVARATILLPIDRTLGHSVALLPVQENVAWFDQWGTKPLVIGPFKRCASPVSGRVCDPASKVLATTPSVP